MTSMRRCKPVHYHFLKNMSTQFSFSFLSTILLTAREYRSFGISQINLFAGMSSSRQRRTICFSTGLQTILAKLHFRWQNPIKKRFFNLKVKAETENVMFQLMSKISSIIRTNLDIRRDIPLSKVVHIEEND